MRDADLEPWIEATARELRQPVPVSANFDRKVMVRIRATTRARRWGAARRLLRRGATAAAIAVIAGAVWMASQIVHEKEVAGIIAPAPAEQSVQFVVVAPDAGEVTLVGDFNDWDAAATPMHRESSGGIWAVTLPLSTGRYQYAFVIDGTEWRSDPAAPAAPIDDFGAPNSILAVTDRPS